VLARASGRDNRSVHIREDFNCNKGEHGFDMTDLRFLYCTENSHEYTFIKSFDHHFIFITPIRTLLIVNRKGRSLTPYSKTKKSLYGEYCFRKQIWDNGSSQNHERQFLPSTKRA
jgi:hypothetical protein